MIYSTDSLLNQVDWIGLYSSSLILNHRHCLIILPRAAKTLILVFTGSRDLWFAGDVREPIKTNKSRYTDKVLLVKERKTDVGERLREGMSDKV